MTKTHLEINRQVAKQLLKERPAWRPRLEYAGIIAVRLDGIDRWLLWDSSNDAWGADVYRDDQLVEPTEIIHCVVTDVDTRETDPEVIAQAIIKETERYQKRFATIATTDLDRLASEMIDIAIQRARSTRKASMSEAMALTQNIVDTEMWRPVEAAFPNARRHELDLGTKVTLAAAVENVVKNPDNGAALLFLPPIAGNALRTWLRHNL